MKFKPLCAVVMLTGIGACATAKPVTDAGQSAPPGTSASSSLRPTTWSGTLQPTQQRTGSALPTSQNKAFGTVKLTAINSERARISISVSTPLQSSTTLNWTLNPGRCGSGSAALVGNERFPMIDVSSDGRGQLNNQMLLTLPETGSYHVNIYWGQTMGLNDVMTCANLRRE